MSRKRMKRTTRREEYREKFNEQMQVFNYIMQDVSRSSSAKHHTRSTGLSRIKVIYFRHMQENSEY